MQREGMQKLVPVQEIQDTAPIGLLPLNLLL